MSKSIYDLMWSRIEQLAVSDVKDKVIRLHEYEYLIKMAMRDKHMDNNDLQYFYELTMVNNA